MSNVPGQTRLVGPSDAYTPPANRPIDRIAEQTRKLLGRVDFNGRPLPKDAPSDVTNFAEPPSEDESRTAPAAMQPNPLQGGGGVSVPTPRTGSTMLQLAHQLANGAPSPIPEGYAPPKPR